LVTGRSRLSVDVTGSTAPLLVYCAWIIARTGWIGTLLAVNES
jgi:hypothetical protein